MILCERADRRERIRAAVVISRRITADKRERGRKTMDVLSRIIIFTRASGDLWLSGARAFVLFRETHKNRESINVNGRRRRKKRKKKQKKSPAVKMAYTGYVQFTTVV